MPESIINILAISFSITIGILTLWTPSYEWLYKNNLYGKKKLSNQSRIRIGIMMIIVSILMIVVVILTI